MISDASHSLGSVFTQLARPTRHRKNEYILNVLIPVIPRIDQRTPKGVLMFLMNHFSRYILLMVLCPAFHAAGQGTIPSKESPYTLKSYEKIMWGIRSGINLTTPHFEDGSTRQLLSAKSTLGWMLGGLAQFKIQSRYAIQAEVSYSREPNRFAFDHGRSEMELALSFLDVKLLFLRRFPFHLGSLPSEAYFGAGPTLAYWLDTSAKMDTAGHSYSLEVSWDGTPSASTNSLSLTGANRWLLGIDLAAGMSVPVASRQRLLLELRGSLGITNLGGPNSTAILNPPYSPSGVLPADLLKCNLTTFSLTASYVFTYNLMESKLGRSNKDNVSKKRKKKPQKKDKNYLNTRIKTS